MKMKKKNLERLTMGVILICTVVGGFIGLSIASVAINFGIAAAVIGATLGGFLLRYSWSALRKKKRRNIPEVDERTALILKRYFLVVLYVVLIGSGALLLALYAMGVQMIETGMLIVYMAILYLLIGIGALVASKV